MKILTILLSTLALLSINACAQTVETNEQYTFLLTGASFAMEDNGWFEIGCETLHAKPLNRAIGGEAIANTANRMTTGDLYSQQELEEIDALIIMQVHNQDISDNTQLLDKYTDYQTPFDRTNYAAAFDYVIKRYLSECYNLKFNEQSKYFNTPYGKPAVIVLCTDWHDGRVTYNTSVRKLAEKWGFPLVEFDKNIGFSKNATHPVTEEQMSLLFSLDKQEIENISFGWHPERGKDTYIQRRMAAIFVDTMQKVFLTK